TFNGSNTIALNGNYNTLTEVNFNGYCADHFVYITGRYNVVTHCNFQNKLAVMTDKAGTGDLVQIIPNATNPGYNTIRFCSFQHIPGMGGDYGNECIRIGNSTVSSFISRTTVEYCYFEDTGLGDSEAISVKSRENVLRFNTMNNNPDAMFVFRNGDNNVAYSNFFINSGGIRVKEANNIFCYNNYFEKAGATGSMSAVSYIYDTSNSTYVLDNIHFLHNTFVDCGLIDLGGVGATNGTWANNIFKKTGTIFNNPNNGTVFKGNLYKGTLGISIPSGMTNNDPLLTLNADGYYGLSASSPCIDASDGSYPPLLNIPNIDTLLFDIQGKTRPASRTLKDVGCEEYNAGGTSINRPLKLSDVGPSYLKSASSMFHPSVDPFELQVSQNPESQTIAVSYSLSSESRVQVALLNIHGILLRSSIIDQRQSYGRYTEQIPISDLPSGIYLVRLINSNQSRTVKFIHF
ncbi:MAG: T9SS type A sorting domain-containing protein, partial [Bacteroidia bacterium]|nr:T9SS type A sorting domain-containing protein [Bacteroidia bacterium]